MKYVRDDDIKAAFVTMLNKLIYGHRLILAPYLKALENSSGDEAIQRIQHLELLLDQNSEQRETLTKLMAQGYINQILYNQETNALLLQAETYRSDIEAISICMTGDSAKVTETNLLLHFVSHADMLTNYSEELFESYADHIEINTMDAKGEVLITIMASLAQQESQSLSQNVKLGLQYRYQQGKVQINHNRFLGYTKDADGNLIIDPEQAEIVKRIYREYLEGLSMDKIAAGLERDGILTGAGGKRWHTSTINKILRNEKYIGDALLQKTYTTDFLSKTRVKNNGLVPQYYVEGNHEAIIPKDIYLQVQEELVRRRVVKTSANGKKRSYSCNHCFSQIVICGECGEMFRRLHWNNRGVKSIV